MTGHTRSRTSRRRVAGLAGLALALPLLASGVASASTPGPRAPSPLAAAGPLVHVGTTPAVPGDARQLGALAGGSEITGGIVLAPSDPAALTAAATAVSDPSSPDYGQYLGQGQFAKRFGPAPAVLTAVETLLHAGGLRVTGVSEDHLLVSFAGSAADSEATFHTQIERWRLASGRLGTETSGAPSLPAGIAKDVTAVIGLDDLVVPHSMLEPADLHGGAAHRDAPTRTTTPGAHKTTSTSVPPPGPVACPAAVTDAQGLDGITDQQLAAGYGVDGLYGAGDFGAGQTVDVYELEPFAMSDIAAFDECYFGASHTSQVTVIPVEGGQPAGAGSGEAFARRRGRVGPRAGRPHRRLRSAAHDARHPRRLHRHRRPTAPAVVSTSWGLCESGAQLGDPGLQQAENEVFEQAAVQGQSVFGPAGDDGSDDCSTGTTPATPYLSVDDPASQPFVVSVGGTTIYSTPPDSAPGEAVWNDGPGGGGGRRHLQHLGHAGVAAGLDRARRLEQVLDVEGSRLRGVPGAGLGRRGGHVRRDALPGTARRHRSGGRRHGHHRLRRRVRRLDDLRWHVLLDTPVGGDDCRHQRLHHVRDDAGNRPRPWVCEPGALPGRRQPGQPGGSVQRHHERQQRHARRQPWPLPGNARF